jgi:hypothetical protein
MHAGIHWMHEWASGLTSPVIVRLDRTIQYSRDVSDLRIGRGVLGPPLSRRTTAKAGGRSASPLRFLLHVLDVGEGDPLGPFAGIAEIELVLGHEHRIAVDVIGDAGAVGGDEGFQLLAVVG